MTTSNKYRLAAIDRSNGKWEKYWMKYKVDIKELFKRIKEGYYSKDRMMRHGPGGESLLRMTYRAKGPLENSTSWEISKTKDGHVIKSISNLDGRGLIDVFYASIRASKVDIIAKLMVGDKAMVAIDNAWVGQREGDVQHPHELDYVLRQLKLKIERKNHWVVERSELAEQIHRTCDSIGLTVSESNEKHQVTHLRDLSNMELEDYASRLGFNECTSTRSRMNRALSRGPEMRRLIREFNDE